MPARAVCPVSDGTMTSAVNVPAALPDQLFHQAPLPGNMLPDQLLCLPDRRLLGHQPQLVFLQYHDNFVAGVQTERLPVGRRYDEPPPVPIRTLVSSTIHLSVNMAHGAAAFQRCRMSRRVFRLLDAVRAERCRSASSGPLAEGGRGRLREKACHFVPFCAVPIWAMAHLTEKWHTGCATRPI